MLCSTSSRPCLALLLCIGVGWAQPTLAADETAGNRGASPTDPDMPSAAANTPPTPSPSLTDDTADRPQAKSASRRSRTIESVGHDTQSVTMGGSAQVGESTGAESDWLFRFKGFFRGPMRVGIDSSGSLTPGKLQFHAPPVTPDANYTRWAYTNVNPGPWAEMLFQYGNQQVMMTTSIASYNITSGGWRELQDQLGIDRAFLTLKFPEAFENLGGMAWDLGVFSNLYGAMGKYNAGEYETYLMGRTRMAGATGTADLELSDDLKVIVEAGAGAKMDQQYQAYFQDPATMDYKPSTDYPTWQPNPGNKKQVGTTLLVHGHVGVNYRGAWTATAHYLGSFVRDARYNVSSAHGSPTPVLTPEASIQVFGVDLKLDGGWLGDGYLGYSRVEAKNAGSVADAIEVLHSQGGSFLAQNYFEDGNGSIDSIAGQYTFSLAAFLMRPRPFYGQGPDLTVTVFGMYNRITNTGPLAYIDTIPPGGADMSKLKYGTDIIYSPWAKLAVGIRMDAVHPNRKDPTQNFEVLSPKLILRSQFLTHETVVLQYSHYFYGSAYTDPVMQEYVMPWPYGKYGTLNLTKYNMNPPDRDVISLYATMWW
jgi:hypothetical protein